MLTHEGGYMHTHEGGYMHTHEGPFVSPKTMNDRRAVLRVLLTIIGIPIDPTVHHSCTSFLDFRPMMLLLPVVLTSIVCCTVHAQRGGGGGGKFRIVDTVTFFSTDEDKMMS